MTPEQLDPWSAIEPIVGASSKATSQTADKPGKNETKASVTPPLVIPELINRPDDIDDQNVAPIPTAPTDTVDSSAKQSLNTTIPVVLDPSSGLPKPFDSETAASSDEASAETAPNSQNVYDSTPRLLTQAETGTSATPAQPDQDTASAGNPALNQILTTVIGVFVALGLFLLIRLAAVKLYGVHLGITFHVSSSQQMATQINSEDGTSVTVPFGEHLEQPQTTPRTEQPGETRETDGDVGSDDSPFRIRRAA